MKPEHAAGCRWPGGCDDYAYFSMPVALCERHGAEVGRDGRQIMDGWAAQTGAGSDGNDPLSDFAPDLRATGQEAAYRAFLAKKLAPTQTQGIKVAASDLHPGLYDFQRAVVLWALRKGRAAIFGDCGLGKSQMQLEWARLVGGRVLIFAPLCVGGQTARIAHQFGIDAPVKQVRTATEIETGINIANYEIAAKFVDANLSGLVCDESSILKSVDGKTKKLLLESFTNVPYRLACTATPCPNDIAELANHAEFLGVTKRTEMLATFFVHDDEGWRLRGHARDPFYRWLASWSMAFKSPADLGFDGSQYILPPLTIEDSTVKTDWRREGELFPGFGLKGIGDRIQVRRKSAADRIQRAAELAINASGQVVVWCGLDLESHSVAKAIPGAVEIHGTDKPTRKQRVLEDFIDGQIRVIVTKLKIAGLGLNLQNAATMIFLGLSDSYEGYYQGLRRLWRFGQKQPVTAWIVVSDHERVIVDNVRRKEREADSLTKGIIAAMKDYEQEELAGHREIETFGNIETREGPGWTLHRGDCVESMIRMPDDSVDLTVSSPPFLSLYTYSASEKDLGNSRSPDEFLEQYAFVARQLRRITKPGRLAAIHCQQVATTLNTHGYIGRMDFRGMIIRKHEECGWIYHGEVCIDKNPQAQAIRTHAKALLFVQKGKDSSWLAPALADYLLLFRKPGDNQVPIVGDVTNEEWITFAHPVWYDISESGTLNVAEGREDADERHICALQLETIERAIRLWSNRGDVVYDPFMGIGSVGYVALQQGRRVLGSELKPRYWETAILNMGRSLSQRKQQDLFDNVTPQLGSYRDAKQVTAMFDKHLIKGE